MTTEIVLAAAGFAAGFGVAALAMRGRLDREQAGSAALRATLARREAEAAIIETLQRQVIAMRHDMRGILSPALLVSDRLLTHEDAYVRRAGEVMIQTVERATQRLNEARSNEARSNEARLDEARPDQSAQTSAQA